MYLHVHVLTTALQVCLDLASMKTCAHRKCGWVKVMEKKAPSGTSTLPRRTDRFVSAYRLPADSEGRPCAQSLHQAQPAHAPDLAGSSRHCSQAHPRGAALGNSAPVRLREHAVHARERGCVWGPGAGVGSEQHVHRALLHHLER